MEVEARDKLNNNHPHYQPNGTSVNGKVNGASKDVELPLIKRKSHGSTDLENGQVTVLNSSQKPEHGLTEANELVEGHGIQPDHSTT